jgi:serpin B
MKAKLKNLLIGLLIPWVAACNAVVPSPVVEPVVSPPATETEEVVIPSKNLQSPIELQSVDAAPDDVRLLSDGLNQFAVDLYRELGKTEPQNTFFSPYSISLALTMAYAGADGETAQEMASVFHYPPSINDLHAVLNSLDQSLYVIPDYMEGEESGFTLNIANSIWGQADYPFLSTYLDVLAKNYGAGLRAVDFKHQADQVRQDINDWVEEETQDKIQDLLPPGSLNSDTRLVLANAIYFNAAWRNEFVKELTENKDFYTMDGETVPVEMMRQQDRFRYKNNERIQIVEMPYVNTRYSMVLVMPKEQDLLTYQQTLDNQTLSADLEKLSSGELILSMPKFEFEDGFSVADALRSLGMPSAFSPGQANFSRMSEPQSDPLFISDVFHKAYVAVDEEGTEAAAATAVIMEATGAMIEDPPVPLVFDHPFMFLIRDEQTGIYLFMGNLLTPTDG